MLVNIDGKKVTIERGIDGESVYACYEEIIHTATLNYVNIVKGCTPEILTETFESNSKDGCKRQIEEFKENSFYKRKYINTIWNKRKERKRVDITFDIKISLEHAQQGL